MDQKTLRQSLLKQRKQLIENLRSAINQRQIKLSDGLAADSRTKDSLIERRNQLRNDATDLERNCKELKAKKQQQRSLLDSAAAKKSAKKRELELIEKKSEEMRTQIVANSERTSEAPSTIVDMFERYVGLAVDCDYAGFLELRLKVGPKEGRISARRSAESGRFEVQRCEPPIAQVPDLSDRFAADGRQWGALLVAFRAALQSSSSLLPALSSS
uniref:Kinetochore protein SPC25 n=1 Tax=Plectus sambesii TaxID=2011161 RepID=A0A914UXY1_9BILA